MKYLALALMTFVFAAPAMAQTKGGYVPFPQNFQTLSAAEKEAIGKTVDDNTEKYFHSPAYGKTLEKFVKQQNPLGMNECKELKMNKDGNNKITIVEPLLFKEASDNHPLVGKWEQNASFKGCGRTYNFTINASGNQAATPDMSLKQ